MTDRLHVRSLLGSRVARRMVTLFAACALGPMVALAAVAYVQVSGQLREASLDRRHQAAKSVGMELASRLRRLDAELTLVAASIVVTSNDSARLPSANRSRLRARFRAVSLHLEDGRRLPLVGAGATDIRLAPAERQHLAKDLAVVRVDGERGVWLLRQIAGPAASGLLVAEPEPGFLWDSTDLAPPTMALVVVGPTGNVLLPAAEDRAAEDVLVQLPPDTAPLNSGNVGELAWSDGEGDRVGTYWTVPLGFEFLLPRLTVLVSEPESLALAPMASARTTMVLVSLLSLWVVLLLSLVQVRRSLVPLDQLEDGTRRLGAGEFDRPVVVTSGDEFEDLAGAFNSMAGRIKQQFHTLSTRSAIDQAVLSSLDVNTILATALERLPTLVDCDAACLVTLGEDPAEILAPPLLWERRDGRPKTVDGQACLPSSGDVAGLQAARQVLPFERTARPPGYAAALSESAWSHGAALALSMDGRLVGVLTVARHHPFVTGSDDVVQLRHLADQITVALSNASLLRALDQLNLGTLQALARTVDAKSPWTAGHSQRVTTMAVDLGRQLGMPADALDLIGRGSLLHDIGKIAVPSAILNKPGPLTPEEFAVMKEHPATGARILEPIREYRPLVPIVLQHHEWFDGRGYPAGLSGEGISVEARIVAVADVFDAVTSERPYRQAMELTRAVDIIRRGSGTQFDPRIVRAFLALVERQDASRTHAA